MLLPNFVGTLQQELAQHKCTAERLEVWQRGVDTVRFNPTYKCQNMRARLTDGNAEDPLLVHVGRLGAGRHSAFFHYICIDSCVAASSHSSEGQTQHQ